MTVVFERGWTPGAIGAVVSAHGAYYAATWGFGAYFEAKVAREMAEFVERYDALRDLLLTAWTPERQFLGAITIDGSAIGLPPGQAHLRWFIATDKARGSGTGGRLMAEAVDFMRAAGYGRCYLTTFAGLDAARRLYERHGFQLTDETPGATWGVDVVEQRFEAQL